MSSRGASQQLLFPFLFLLFSLSFLHPSSFAVGQWLEKAARPVNVGREEFEMKWDNAPKEDTRVNVGRDEHEMKWDNSPKEDTRVPKNTKVEVQMEDNASKDNFWVPIDQAKSEEPLQQSLQSLQQSLLGNDEVVEVHEAEVLVLGAGTAGITVAQRLKEEGVEGVVVVEGSERIGGRVKDVQFGGITVELGANWVHRLIHQSSGKYSKVRGRQFRRDKIFGPRCNPIEDLCKVSL